MDLDARPAVPLPQLQDVGRVPNDFGEMNGPGLQWSGADQLLELADRAQRGLGTFLQPDHQRLLGVRGHAVLRQDRGSRGDAAQGVPQLMRHRGSDLSQHRQMLVLEERLAHFGEVALRTHAVRHVMRDDQDDVAIGRRTLQTNLEDLLTQRTAEAPHRADRRPASLRAR